MMQGRTVSGRRAALRIDLGILAVVGIVLVAALSAAGVSLYQQIYRPAAFVHRYLHLLSDGHASDALRVPGVSVDLVLQTDADIDAVASEALLRTAALSRLTDYEITSEKQKDGVYQVTASYEAAGTRGTSTYTVVQDGW